MLKWLDRFPLVWLVLLALWMLVAPVTPEPHLIEKMRMLSDGTLSQPIDIFDLLMHSTPAVLLLVRLVRLKSKT
ncbi:hypothetical protein [Rhodoferax sp. PAMC 29310]|uniref:hypothetical protein n=1 Tax=Rhodoferax sp. PAMC 29310 TaxID=2822760 RepID=UPI001F0A5458|nr:hypothetical protein [Rhodoferax sp. PAMC 29310]